MRQVDGEASDFEVSGKSGSSSKTERYSDLRLACTHSIEHFRDVSRRKDIQDVVFPLRSELKKHQEAVHFVHRKLHPSKFDS